MKMKYKSVGNLLLFSCCLLISFSCEKKKTTTQDQSPITTELTSGFPSDLKKINGYFYAASRTNFNNFNTSYGVNLYATFGDAARSLLSGFNHYTDSEQNNFFINKDRGNVNVGTISFNGRSFANPGGASYSQYYNLNSANYSSQWVTEGNGSFKPINLVVQRGFPAIVQPSSTNSFSVSLSNDFIVNFQSFISNYDSVSVKISSDGSSSFYAIQKTVSSNTSFIKFTSGELSSKLSTTTYGNLIISAYNYSNKTIEDKVYVFELASKLDMQIYISP
jgi:hypothetical protein